jgi:antitoxin component YwqK of YwqJK toxin-antitoxin module
MKYLFIKIITLLMVISISVFADQKVYYVGDLAQGNNIFIEANTGKPANGVVKLYYGSGQLEHEIQYKDGKRNGTTKRYTESGQLKSLYTYKNGQRNGIAKMYAKAGYSVVEYANDTAVRGTINSSDGTRSSPMTNEQLAILSQI